MVISLLGITEVTNDSSALTPDKMLLITPAKTEQKTNDGDCRYLDEIRYQTC